MKRFFTPILICILALMAVPVFGGEEESFYSYMNYRNRLGNEAGIETLEEAHQNGPAAVVTLYGNAEKEYTPNPELDAFPEGTAFVYRSANIYGGQASVRNNTSFLVFAEQHFDDKEAALAYMQELGLTDLIDSLVGSVILFTPEDPDAGFGEADLENYYHLHKAIYTKGFVPMADCEYMGTTGKIYFIGIDGGATFLNNYVATGDPECIGQCAGLLLIGGEMAEGTVPSAYVPAYIVNEADNAATAWKAVNGANVEETEDGIAVAYNEEVPLRRVYTVEAEEPDVKALILDAFYKVMSKTMRVSVIRGMTQETLVPAPFTDICPIPELHRYALAPRNTIMDGVTLEGKLHVDFFQEEIFSDLKTMYDQYLQTWYEAIPEDVINGTAPEGSVPVIIALHGTGDDPLMFMDEIGALEVAGREGAAIICPFQEELVISHEGARVVMGVPIYEGIMDQAMPRLLDLVLDKYPALDRTRVYVLGYSMGGGSTYRAMYGCMEKIAAAVPMAGMHPDMFYESTEEQDAHMREIGFPVMELTSTFDLGFDQANACLNENTMYIFDKYARLNGIEFDGNYDYEASPYFGRPYDDFSVSTLMGEFRTFRWTVNNPDGLPVMAMSCTENTTHALYPCYAELAWDFFKDFSRDPDTGAIVYQAQ